MSGAHKTLNVQGAWASENRPMTLMSTPTLAIQVGIATQTRPSGNPDANDSRAIFVTMHGDHPARFHCYKPQPELAALHAIDFRTEVDGSERVHLDPLVLGRRSLLTARRPQPHDKPPPCKPGRQ